MTDVPKDLAAKKCIPCEGDVLPFTIDETEKYLTHLKGWLFNVSTKSLSKQFNFKDFADALAFANKIGAIAEEEAHHPDLYISWGKVGVVLSTHAIHGLSENDFILAAKIDEIPRPVL